MLYRGQNESEHPPSQLTLLLILPHVTEPMRRECVVLGLALETVGVGVHRLRDGFLGHPV